MVRTEKSGKIKNLKRLLMSQYRNGLSMTVTAQTHYSATTARTIKTALLCSQPYSLLNGTSNGVILGASEVRLLMNRSYIRTWEMYK